MDVVVHKVDRWKHTMIGKEDKSNLELYFSRLLLLRILPHKRPTGVNTS